MSDTSTQGEQPTIQQLRERADQAATLEQQNAAIARENAFLKAGINPDDKQLGYFVRGYDGDLNPEAIKAAATEAGFLSTTPAPTTEAAEEPQPAAEAQPSEDQLAQDQLATTVAAESGALTEERRVDLMDEGFQQFQQTMQSGAERKDAAAHVIGRAIAKGLGKE